MMELKTGELSEDKTNLIMNLFHRLADFFNRGKHKLFNETVDELLAVFTVEALSLRDKITQQYIPFNDCDVSARVNLICNVMGFVEIPSDIFTKILFRLINRFKEIDKDLTQQKHTGTLQ